MTDSSGTSIRLAVDVGGTFTDVVSHNSKDGALVFDKVPTTPANPSSGVLDAFSQIDAPPSYVGYFAHGTTLGLNALLTRTGAKTAIVTTKGFRDVYLLGRTNRDVAYDFKYRKPKSLVPRDLIFEVPERMNFRGEVLLEFDREAALEVARKLSELGIGSVAVCFLHSYVNPAHELAMREVLGEAAKGAQVTLSHELTREYREYERSSTAVLDAYIRPLVGTYIGELDRRLREDRFGGRFFLIRSGGGAMTAARARLAPVNLILSGPAGGVLGAAAFGAEVGEPNLITVDMGGTSLDASLIVAGEPVVHNEASFQGLPIMVPSLYINTIGAGGGSIVWVDEAEHLQVGPHSAGAVPGPAAYGAGGTEATFTDAALVCGYLSVDTPLAGTLYLKDDLAREALGKSAKALSMEVEHVADGVIRIAVTKIVGAVRAITVELGHRPADFALLAFGGAGGLIGVEVARELSIGRVIVPPGPGSFAALGMLMADVQHDFSQTRVTELDSNRGVEALEQDYQEMEEEAATALEADGFGPERRRFRRLADMRYRGQEHTVLIPVGDRLDAAEVEALAGTFAEAHKQRYGHALTDPVEVVTIRVRAIGEVERPALPQVPRREAGALSPKGTRSVYRTGKGRVDYSVYLRDDFRFGDELEGPAVITEHTGTTVLHRGDRLTVGRLGELHITVGRDRN